MIFAVYVVVKGVHRLNLDLFAISYSGLLPDPFLSEEKHTKKMKLYLIIKKMVEIESLLSLSHLPLVLAEVHCELD